MGQSIIIEMTFFSFFVRIYNLVMKTELCAILQYFEDVFLVFSFTNITFMKHRIYFLYTWIELIEELYLI